MLPIRGVGIKRTILAVLGIAFLATSLQTRAESERRKGTTDGILQISVQGEEFRNSSSYPDDQLDSGYDANAYNSWQLACQKLEEDIRLKLGDSVSFFDCGEERNLSKRSDRVQYTSEALIYTNTQIYWEVAADEIAGDFISAEDFSDEFKWQTSRGVAVDAYQQACLGLKEDALQEFGRNLLFADCGVTTESNSKYGWQYKSTPTLFILVPPPVEPKPIGCSNGKNEGEQWWSVSTKNPIREYGTCSWGGSKTNLYERQTLKICRNGDIEVRQERRGAYLGSTGECKPEPTNCGAYSDGSIWYEVRGYTDGFYQCRHDRRYVPALFQRLVQYQCYDGRIHEISDTQGDLVRLLGRCERPHRPDRPHRPRPDRPHPCDGDGRDRDHDRDGIRGDGRRDGDKCPPKPQPPKPNPPKPDPVKPVQPKPDPVKPAPVKPKPHLPKPLPPQEPSPGQPNPPKPGPVRPVQPKPSPTKPDPVKPAPVKPKPQLPKPDPVKPAPVRPKPQLPKPDPVKPAPVRPKPQLPKPDPVKPAPVRPKPQLPTPNPQKPGNPKPGNPKPGNPKPGNPKKPPFKQPRD